MSARVGVDKDVANLFIFVRVLCVRVCVFCGHVCVCVLCIRIFSVHSHKHRQIRINRERQRERELEEEIREEEWS